MITNIKLKYTSAKKCWRLIILGLLSCLMLSGCISNKYIERQQYLLDVPKSFAKKSVVTCQNSIFVDHVVARAPFDELDFLYRVKSDRYLVDYYNGFLASPSEQIESLLTAYLRAYGKFGLEAAELAKADYRLQVKIIELYADYACRSKPQAVISLHFIVTKLVADKPIVLVDRIFHEHVALKEKNTISLLQAWNVGLKNILTQATRVLNRKIGC